MKFRKATKESSRLRLALIGPSGSGKTYTALSVASHLGKRVALIDTEKGSASKYADLFEFDVLELERFNPLDYVAAIAAAAGEGYDVLVIDSLSHAWVGKGGSLETHDDAVARQKTKNSYTAWRDVTPQHNAMIEAIVQAGCHVIATMRAKTEYVQEKDQSGRTVVRKVGLAPVQRDGLEYEFDVVGDIDIDHTLAITKSRCAPLADRVIRKPGADLAKELASWLGASPAPAPSPAPTVAQRKTSPPPTKAPAKEPPAEKKALPAGEELLDRLAKKDAELAALFICEEGELLRYLQTEAMRAKFPGDILEWGPPAVELAITNVKRFEELAKKHPGAMLRDSLDQAGEEAREVVEATAANTGYPPEITTWSVSQAKVGRGWLRGYLERARAEVEA